MSKHTFIGGRIERNVEDTREDFYVFIRYDSGSGDATVTAPCGMAVSPRDFDGKFPVLYMPLAPFGNPEGLSMAETELFDDVRNALELAGWEVL